MGESEGFFMDEETKSTAPAQDNDEKRSPCDQQQIVDLGSAVNHSKREPS